MKREINEYFDEEKEISSKIEEIEEILTGDIPEKEKLDTIRVILEEIKDDFDEIHKSALTDDLTGLLTKKYIREIYYKIADRIKDEHKYLGLIVIDVDRLKKINDTFGHLVGTQVIEEMSKTIKKDIRKSDFASRYGGDEFVVLCVVKDRKSLKSVLKRIERNIHHVPINKDFAASGTIGYSMSYRGRVRFSKIFDKADKMMYEKKKERTGRWHHHK
jgi:diguanylate cyclase (GGDEF)-like protein